MTAVSAPRLPQATPITGRCASAPGAQRRERRAVAAEGDDRVAVRRVAGLGDGPLLALGVDLHDVDAVLVAPALQRVERVVELPARVHDEAQAG